MNAMIRNVGVGVAALCLALPALAATTPTAPAGVAAPAGQPATAKRVRHKKAHHNVAQAAKPEEKKAVETPAAKPAEKPATKPTDKPAAKPAEKATEKPAAKPTEKPAAKPTEKPAAPVEKPAEKAPVK